MPSGRLLIMILSHSLVVGKQLILSWEISELCPKSTYQCVGLFPFC